MGALCSSNKNNYSRNELLALNRDAEKYGINLTRYQQFCSSNNYHLANLIITDNDNIDNIYCEYWNKWKQRQSWGINLPDLDKNIITQLAYAPTKLNNCHHIPSLHDHNQVESLKNFYSLHKWTDEINHLKHDEQYDSLTNIDNFIYWILDKHRYHEITEKLIEKYSLQSWELSQTLNSKWRDLIQHIQSTSHKDIPKLQLIQELTRQKTDELLIHLDNKIII